MMDTSMVTLRITSAVTDYPDGSVSFTVDEPAPVIGARVLITWGEGNARRKATPMVVTEVRSTGTGRMVWARPAMEGDQA